MATSSVAVNLDLQHIEEKEQEETLIVNEKLQTQNDEKEIYIEVPDKSPIASSSEDTVIKQRTLLLEDEFDLKQPLPLPYKRGCFHKIKYHIESFLVIHPRFYALYLLYRSTWPRALVFVDMYTDINVAIGLYRGEERIWFMLSCLFIALPFVLVWSASLRFIQNYLQKLHSYLTINKSKSTKSIEIILNLCLIIYMFPPIGSLIIALYEVYWAFSDIFHGFKAFIFGTGIVEAEDRQTKAMKSYRRAIEIFSESVPQTLLQLYIWLRLQQREQNGRNYGIELNDLYLSLAVSFLNLCVSFYGFRKEAKLHGMSWAEYALSVLQMGEVPVIRLVPRLPAIRKGFVEDVNFCGFIFDKESISPLLEAVNSIKCKLKTVKLSIGSLSKLDIPSCKLLGEVLYNAGINVFISRTSSLIDIKNLFETLDKDHNGYLDQSEFLSAVKSLNISIQNASSQQQQRIFQKLAIRRLKKRDRVYFYDFFQDTASLRRNADFDLTQIDYPLHFIFYRIRQIVTNYEEVNDEEMVNNFQRLYQFCQGLHILDQIDATVNEHIFYIIVDTLSLINSHGTKYQKLALFVDRIFFELLNNETFGDDIYLKRNEVFGKEVEKKLQLNEKCSEFVKKLKMAEYSGYNIFEFCFLYKTEYSPYACKLFVNLLNVWLQKVNYKQINDADYLENHLTKEDGELYYLFQGTNGFHVKDLTGHTPLYWAAKLGLDEVVEFFGKCVFKIMIKDEECEWIRDQDYLHSILHHLLRTENKNPNSEALRSLFSVREVIDINYQYEDKYLAHHILKLRRLVAIDVNNHSKRNLNLDEVDLDSDYALKALEILDSLNYDFVANSHESSVLHYAEWLHDHEAVVLFIKLCRQRSAKYLESLLTYKGSKGRTALENAILSGTINIAKSLILCPEQSEKYWDLLLGEIKKAKFELKKKWILCFGELMKETNYGILNEIDDEIKHGFYEAINHFRQLSVIMMSQKATSKETLHEYAYIDDIKEICSKLQSDLGIKQSFASAHDTSILPDTALQYAQLSKHFGKVCDIDYKNGILASIATDHKVMFWKKTLPKKGLFQKEEAKYTFERVLTVDLEQSNHTFVKKPYLIVGMNTFGNLMLCTGSNASHSVLSIYSIKDMKEARFVANIDWFSTYISCATFMDDVVDTDKDRWTMNSKYILAASGDGKCVVFKFGMHIHEPFRCWNAAKAAIAECCHYVYKSHNRTLIAFVSMDGCLYLTEFAVDDEKETYLAKIKVCKKAQKGLAGLQRCAISPNGALIATGDGNGVIKVFNIEGLKWENAISIKQDDDDWNGVTEVCEFDINANANTVGAVAKLKWIDNSCLIVSMHTNFHRGDLYYFKVTDSMNNKWGFGQLHTNHEGQRISSIAVDPKDNILVTGGWDFSIGIHDLTAFKMNKIVHSLS